MDEKTLDNINVAETKEATTDLKVFGNSDAWQLICKASSESEGWMKSTKALEVDGVGCFVQVTTQQRNLDGSYAIAESVTFAPQITIKSQFDSEMNLIGRKLTSNS